MTFDGLVTVALFAALGARAGHTPAQSDTYWLLRAGRDVVRDHTIPLTDTYTFTAAGRRWPNHEWLTEAAFYVLYRIGGMPVLTATVGIALLTMFGLVWQLMAGAVGRRAVLLGLTVPGTFATSVLRPQPISLLLAVVVSWLIVSGRWRWLPVVFLVWANLHAGVVLGGGVVVAWLLTLVVWERTELRRAFVVAALSAVAVALNPLGPSLVLYAFEKSGETAIEEFRPAWELPLPGTVLAVVAVLLAISLRPLLRDGDRNDRFLAVTAVLLFPLAVRYGRSIPPFLVFALPAVSRAWERWRPSAPRPPDPRVLHTVAAVVFVVAATAWVATSWSEPDPDLDWEPISDQSAAAVAACEGPLYNRFNDGGYLVWITPDVEVFVDSRDEPFDPAFIAEHFELERTGDYEAVFDRYDITCAFLPPRSRTAIALQRDGWRVESDDGTFLMLRHPDA